MCLPGMAFWSGPRDKDAGRRGCATALRPPAPFLQGVLQA
ncbi:hypothetical protein LC55x_4484 [Lysobacter capsici]|nr:hypothetical protein LC55x_4484 [Lysobacter capsici]